MDTDGPIVVGRFGKVFGVSGWIKVISFTAPKENILKFKPWLIKKDNSWQEFCFTDSKKQSNNIVVKLPGCDSPEEARNFTNIEIGVRHKQLPKLPEGEYYWHDLIGLKVINKGGKSLGIVEDLIATGVNDVLVVGSNRRLIPYISRVICGVDMHDKVINVDWEEDFL